VACTCSCQVPGKAGGVKVYPLAPNGDPTQCSKLNDLGCTGSGGADGKTSNCGEPKVVSTRVQFVKGGVEIKDTK
jgi:hypothetical protein